MTIDHDKLVECAELLHEIYLAIDKKDRSTWADKMKNLIIDAQVALNEAGVKVPKVLP